MLAHRIKVNEASHNRDGKSSVKHLGFSKLNNWNGDLNLMNAIEIGHCGGNLESGNKPS